MTERVWQVFAAPGPEDEPLPAPDSPWISDRVVQFAREYWDLILDFARALDRDEAERLFRQSGNAGLGDVTVRVDPATIPETVRFLERVERELQDAPELIPEATDELPDEFENSELARMARAVRAVYEESGRRGEPFQAWNE